MDLLIKGIDKNENKCMICRKEIYSDISINKTYYALHVMIILLC